MSGMRMRWRSRGRHRDEPPKEPLDKFEVLVGVTTACRAGRDMLPGNLARVAIRPSTGACAITWRWQPGPGSTVAYRRVSGRAASGGFTTPDPCRRDCVIAADHRVAGLPRLSPARTATMGRAAERRQGLESVSTRSQSAWTYPTRPRTGSTLAAGEEFKRATYDWGRGDPAADLLEGLATACWCIHQLRRAAIARRTPPCELGPWKTPKIRAGGKGADRPLPPGAGSSVEHVVELAVRR